MSRFRPITAGGFDRARRLRRDATEAEMALWLRLRNRRFENLKFRRQVPFGPYVADFFCEERSLIIEVDGGQHASSQTDAKRTQYLESQGMRVVRFWNNDVLRNVEGVLEHLKRFIANHPSPLGEGGARASARGRVRGLAPQAPLPAGFARAERAPHRALRAHPLPRERVTWRARRDLLLSKTIQHRMDAS